MTRPPAEVDLLHRAQQAAERALCDRLDAAGWPDPAKIAPVLAEIATPVVWFHAERHHHEQRRDGRL